MYHSAFCRKNCSPRLIITAVIGAVFGFFVGVSFPSVSLYKIRNFPLSLGPSVGGATSESKQFYMVGSSESYRANIYKIYDPTNPHGAETLPPAIVVPETDLYLRRLWGEPSQDLKKKPKYLVTFTVGIDQMNNIDKCVKKFSEDFQIMLFHYDGRTTEWDRLEWSKTAIHVSARKQTKWWFAKRFLHPDIVAAYEYIFIWDEDLGVENFNAERYIELVKKHDLEISQPGLEPNVGLTWQMTKRREDQEVHKFTKEKPGWCSDPHFPPCAAFVEIMAPVFSQEAWRCVWYLIQNDLVHGWGLDFALRRCVSPAHEKIGVVDSQWIVHQGIRSLGNQGETLGGISPRDAVRIRSKIEWAMFQKRLVNADLAYVAQRGKG
ncbi:hypothetical protein ERO13_A03G032500v2 [Gossypium hirsutum]|uniref:Uncharacterized protein LOC107963889 n=2 Tax=Gossypium TaxID=3633 RepID=A0A1U8PXM7_GOSHI|nr:uncharacterized protein LOC107963889 [Gossypium hirsutum]XP_016755895.1 uncharacterized protein LOC107963889 [Gossypium hirsutum]XP_016755896.1 uncharacterized protein LOC107963889 [Gossypium hirsutum]XP_016755897.1 uncharacterized protein LOC107963889 [Gossypium hirsutum]XP_016755898.1 uncharacterized protein LOC107963889 [Gossypium hirsutum]XP_016755899.1 uncharacterized protein LOC107963889 [Gossypium hirsutum]XP_016755900.1 uncharacterized protein LOC107963889 [Gossypium hirsutum]XP_0